MNKYIIEIEWKGPYNTDFVISKMDNGGNKLDGYSGPDYGLYQIYGKHILCDKNILLYIGEAIEQTFSKRFKQHKEWLDKEEDIKIYLGRIENDAKYSKINDWASWEYDVKLAERILIYKYSPNYNSSGISREPLMPSGISYKLVHNNQQIDKNKLHKLKIEDNAPQDWNSLGQRPKE